MRNISHNSHLSLEARSKWDKILQLFWVSARKKLISGWSFSLFLWLLKKKNYIFHHHSHPSAKDDDDDDISRHLFHFSLQQSSSYKSPSLSTHYVNSIELNFTTFIFICYYVHKCTVHAFHWSHLWVYICEIVLVSKKKRERECFKNWKHMVSQWSCSTLFSLFPFCRF